jgi:hypothetical protein
MCDKKDRMLEVVRFQCFGRRLSAFLWNVAVAAVGPRAATNTITAWTSMTLHRHPPHTYVNGSRCSPTGTQARSNHHHPSNLYFGLGRTTEPECSKSELFSDSPMPHHKQIFSCRVKRYISIMLDAAVQIKRVFTSRRDI